MSLVDGVRRSFRWWVSWPLAASRIRRAESRRVHLDGESAVLLGAELRPRAWIFRTTEGEVELDPSTLTSVSFEEFEVHHGGFHLPGYTLVLTLETKSAERHVLRSEIAPSSAESPLHALWRSEVEIPENAVVKRVAHEAGSDFLESLTWLAVSAGIVFSAALLLSWMLR